jgi:signal transduction histidine kinase
MQTVSEREKAFLARELHDELGGLLVAASMDLAWLEGHLGTSSEETRRKMLRLRQALAGAVDLKRKIIEDLRPTLLDNVGLFAALRWLVKNSCAQAGVDCASQFPAAEPHFRPDVSIALFRIAQEALAITLKYAWVSAAQLRVCVAGQTSPAAPVLTLCITGRGADEAVGDPDGTEPSIEEAYGLAALRHRIATLGGEINLNKSSPQEVNWTASLPLEPAAA